MNLNAGARRVFKLYFKGSVRKKIKRGYRLNAKKSAFDRY